MSIKCLFSPQNDDVNIRSISFEENFRKIQQSTRCDQALLIDRKSLNFFSTYLSFLSFQFTVRTNILGWKKYMFFLLGVRETYCERWEMNISY